VTIGPPAPRISPSASHLPAAPDGRAVRIVVVGGGIAGLAAAHRLLELGARHGVTVDVTVCERSPRPGGLVATERQDGYLIEAGPDAFLTQKPWALDLCARLGLTQGLTGIRPDHRRTFVVHRGRLHPLPDGFALLAPARLGPMLRSGLFSWPGKARMLLDLVLPGRPADGDESLAAFVTRRLGREVLERVAQPMVAGIYTSDPETLSLAATMPRFLEMERRHGSVIRGLRRAPDPAPSGARWGLFAAPLDGRGALVTALASHLPAGAVRVDTRVVSIERAIVGDPTVPGTGEPPADRAGFWRLLLAGGSVLEADGVVVATASHAAADLVAGIDRDLAGLLREIPYASSAVVTLAYRRDEVSHPMNGLGFVVPWTERRPILACSFSSLKFPARAPDGRVLFRVFLGGVHDPGVLDRDDAWLTGTAAGELAILLGANAVPRLARVHRLARAMPQYRVGHLKRVSAIESAVARHPGLALAGAAYHGVGVPDCIRSGEAAAEYVLAGAVDRARRGRAGAPGFAARFPRGK
jgi:oxygen-dependent protoporphyrinogen oxidase